MGNEWEYQKATIRANWIDKDMSLTQLVVHMRQEHNFDRSGKSYERKFREWGPEFRKNQTARSWRTTISKVEKRTQLGKSSRVRLRNGTLVADSKFRKLTARYGQQSIYEKLIQGKQRSAEVSAVAVNQPDEMQISTPPPEVPDFSYHWADIPYGRFVSAMQDLGLSDTTDKAKIMTISAKVSESFRDISDITRGSMFPPAHFRTTFADPSVESGEPQQHIKLFMAAVYWMSNNSITMWFHVLESLDARLCKSLLYMLGRMKTTTTRVLIERVCRHALKNRMTKYLHLLNADVVLDAWEEDTSYPVLYALRERQEKLAIRLIRAGADLLGPSGPEVVVAAIERGYDDVIQLLFHDNLDINDKFHIPLRSAQTPLEVAVSKHRLETARKLIQLGAVVPKQQAGITLLGTALRRRQLELARLLLENGACLSPTEMDHPDALLKAAFDRSHHLSNVQEVALAQLMIDSGLDLRSAYSSSRQFDCCVNASGSPLQATARLGNLGLARILIQHGANVNATASVPDCLIKLLIEWGRFHAAHFLIRAGASICPEPELQSRSHLTGSHYKSALAEAVEQDCDEMVKLLLGNGADPNIVEHPGVTLRQTALYVAVTRGNLAITKLLLQVGALVDLKSENLAEGRGWIEENAIHAAVYHGHADIVRALVEAGADVNATASYSGRLGKESITVFEIAAKNPDNEIISSLLCATPTTTSTMTVKAQADLLLSAIKLDDVEMVKALVDAGADLRAATQHNRTLLQEAISRRSVHTIEFLVNAGADLNALGTVTDGSLLQEALNADDIPLARMLIDIGANVRFPFTETDGMTALQHAVRLESVELVRALMQAGADVDEGHTCEPLRLAAERGYVEIVEELLGHGASADPHPTKGYFTPLQAAASSGAYAIVCRLLEAGACVDAGASDERGTAIQAAARCGHTRIVRALLERGASFDVSYRQADYGTALHEAIIGGHRDLALVLLKQYRSDPNIAGPIQWEPEGYFIYGTPLQSAIDNGDQTLALALIEAGARADVLTAQEPERRTPLEAAIEFDSGWALPLVLRAGADVNLAGTYRFDFGIDVDLCCYGPVLVAAVSRGDEEKVRLILQAKADVNATAEIFLPSTQTTVSHLNPLQVAVSKGDERIVNILLDYGADARIDWLAHDDLNAKSTLAVAVRKKLSTALLDRLIQSGAQIDVPAQGNLGRTALQEAATHGDAELAEKLIELGADINAPPSKTAGATALQLAALHGHAGLVSNFLAKGADPWAERAEVNGRTALEGAAEHGRTDLVQLFLNLGNERNLPRCRYARALELALESFETVIGELIKSQIARAKACDCQVVCSGTLLMGTMRARGVRIPGSDRGSHVEHMQLV